MQQHCHLYQTVEDRNNLHEIEKEGPFKCTRNDAWLGHGYYFWEDDVELAHKWAKNAGYGKRYVICQSAYDYDNHNYFDLVGNPFHQRDIRDCYKALRKRQQTLIKRPPLTLSMVLKALQSVLGDDFAYKAIRVRSEYKPNGYLISFNYKRINKEVYNAKPEIQLCVLDKSILTQPYQIVYTAPEQD